MPSSSDPNLRSHPGHYPFISWLTFQRYCSDWIIDGHTGMFDPNQVKKGDRIFLDFFYLDWFVEQVHDQIQQPYILITCDKGGWAPKPELRKILYDPKLAAWFCRNMVFSYHPKLFQLPMGPDVGLFSAKVEQIHPLLKAAMKKPYSKEYVLYMNYYPRKNGGRDEIVKLFERELYCYAVNRSDREWVGKPLPVYYEEMAAAQFVVSPLGFETDCVRTWEALALGTIPIIEHSFLDPLFDGLPVLKIHQWTDVNLPLLEEAYGKLKDLSHEKIYFDYWRDLIVDTQRKIRENEWSGAEWEETQFSLRDLEDLEGILREAGEGMRLVYKGFLSTLRPYQLAQFSSCITSLHLHDPWLDPAMANHLFFSTKDPLETYCSLHSMKKIFWVANNAQFDRELGLADAVFLDLTYYGSSLYIQEFFQSVVSDGNFRHSLKRDLDRLHAQLPPSFLLCGNRVDDPYVSACLEQFGKEKRLALKKRGHFWYFRQP